MIIASIDIGTNTVLLLVAEADPENKKIIPIKNIYRIPRIGKGLKPGMPVSQEKIAQLIEILTEYGNIAEKLKCEKIIATATNALRIASNSEAILMTVKKKIGIEIDIIPGEREAELSFLGASGDSKNNEMSIIIDIGGGSTEIIYGNNEIILFNKSFPIGAVNSTENILKHTPPELKEINELKKNIEETFKELKEKKFDIGRGVAIAGTPTTLACIKMNLNNFDEELIEGSSINYGELKELTEDLSILTPEQILKSFNSVVKGREDVLLSGSYILLIIMEILRLDKVIVSTKGIRYGAIINYLNKLP